jgi:hypothetical protein
MAIYDDRGLKIHDHGTTLDSLHVPGEENVGHGKVESTSPSKRDELVERVRSVHQGRCPQCGGPGPVDIHTTYQVWSAIFFTTWRKQQELCCKACGVENQVGGVLFCLVLGWWGFPFGLILTPVQIMRNLWAIFFGTDPRYPSKMLRKRVHATIALSGGARQPPKQTMTRATTHRSLKTALPKATPIVKVHYGLDAIDRNGSS